MPAIQCCDRCCDRCCDQFTSSGLFGRQPWPNAVADEPVGKRRRRPDPLRRARPRPGAAAALCGWRRTGAVARGRPQECQRKTGSATAAESSTDAESPATMGSLPWALYHGPATMGPLVVHASLGHAGEECRSRGVGTTQVGVPSMRAPRRSERRDA